MSSSVRLRRSALPLDSEEYAVATSCTMPHSFSQSVKWVRLDGEGEYVG